MAVAKSTCACCHHIHPRNTMHRVTRNVASGNSVGGGMSFGNKNSKGSRNPRYFMGGRKYFRKTTAWYCASCYASIEKGEAWKGLFAWMFIASLIGGTFWLKAYMEFETFWGTVVFAFFSVVVGVPAFLVSSLACIGASSFTTCMFGA